MDLSHYTSDLDPSALLGFGSALTLLDDPAEVGRLLTGALRSMELADLQAVVLDTDAPAPEVVGSLGAKPLSDSVIDDLRALRTEGPSDEGSVGRPAQQRIEVQAAAHPALADLDLHHLRLIRLGTIDETFGLLVAGTRDAQGHTSLQVSTLQMLAAQAALALHRIRLDRVRTVQEDALRESEARYRALYENAPVAYVSVAPDGTVRMANERAAALLGASTDTLMGRSMPSFCRGAEGNDATAERLEHHLQAGRPLRDEEVLLCRADGESVWVSLSMRPLPRGEEDAAERLVMMIDVTERKEAEAALREARDALEDRVEARTAELERQTERLAALREVDRAILAAESPPEIASVAAARARDLVSCERVSVALFEREEEHVRVLSAQQDRTVLEPGEVFPLEAFPITDRLRAGKVEFLANYEEVPSTVITERLQAAGLRSSLVVPMIVEEELIGTLNLGAAHADAFTDEERRIATDLADRLSIAIRQARLLEAVQQQREQLEVRVQERTAELREANATLKDEVSERKRAERALRKSRERLTRIIDSAIDGIISVQPSLEITLFNAAAESIFRCRAEEAEGRSLATFLTDPFETLVQRHIERHQRGEDEETAGAARESGRYLAAPEGLEARRADGEVFSVEATLCPVQLPGADQYLLILRDIDKLKQAEAELEQLESERSYLQEELRSEHNFDEIVGTSPPMQEVFSAIEQVADTDTTVLITGETGTGKELVARALHDRSTRADQVFVKVNCAALPGDLIESELFGHEKGAFTGATERREGRFELADGGTLLLDEIGELPPETQAKLLRVLQHQEFERVGGSKTIDVDTRILAATNRDLEAAVENGTFRSDLYYRLNIFPIELPPLRDRPGDISLLAEHFREMFAQRTGKDVQRIRPGAQAVLDAYDWPGNVRELANIIERAVILASDASLRVEHLSISAESGAGPSSSFDTLEEAQRRHIERALERTDGVVGGDDGAAQLLDVKRTTLLSRMDRLGIDPDAFRGTGGR